MEFIRSHFYVDRLMKIVVDIFSRLTVVQRKKAKAFDHAMRSLYCEIHVLARIVPGVIK